MTPTHDAHPRPDRSPRAGGGRGPTRRAVLSVAGMVAGALALAPSTAAAVPGGAGPRRDRAWDPRRSAALRSPLQQVEVATGGDTPVSVAYREIGGGPPLLLLQRFRGTLDDWDPAFLDALARRRRVVVFDAPGVGASTGAVAPGISAMAADAAAVAAALDLGAADVLGWSMGGMVAQALAATRPAAVRRLVLDATCPPGNPDLVRPSQGWVDVAVKPTYDLDDVVRLFYTPGPDGRAAATASQARIATRTDPVPPVSPESVGAQAQAIFAYYDDAEALFGRLRTIAAPTLIGAGDRDDAFPMADQVVLLDEIPGSRLAVYPDSAHGFQFQYVGEFTTLVDRFLA